MAESVDGRALLVGEVKLRVSRRDLPRLERELVEKANRLPFVDKYAAVVPLVFAVRYSGRVPTKTRMITAASLIPTLT